MYQFYPKSTRFLVHANALVQKKKRPKGRFFSFSTLLGSHTIDITWEHGAFLDVRDTQEAGGDTLQTDGEASVWRHAVSLSAPRSASLPSALCPSRAPQARIPRTPHGISAPRPHPLLRGIFSHSQLRLSRPTA